MDVCNEFELGKIPFEAPKHEVRKRQKTMRVMSIIWWRPLMYCLDKVLQMICWKLLKGDCFFDKKSKALSRKNKLTR